MNGIVHQTKPGLGRISDAPVDFRCFGHDTEDIRVRLVECLEVVCRTAGRRRFALDCGLKSAMEDLVANEVVGELHRVWVDTDLLLARVPKRTASDRRWGDVEVQFDAGPLAIEARCCEFVAEEFKGRLG
jgi:hypothetical protein